MYWFVALLAIAVSALAAGFIMRKGSRIWRAMVAGVMVLAVLGGVLTYDAPIGRAKGTDPDETLYMAMRLLRDGEYDSALSMAGLLLEEAAYHQAGALIQAAALAAQAEYSLAIERCAATDMEPAAPILAACEAQTPLDAAGIEAVADWVEEQHPVGDAQREIYEAMYQLRYKLLSDDARDAYLSTITGDSSALQEIRDRFTGEREGAEDVFENMRAEVKRNPSLQNVLILTDMAANGVLRHDYAMSDAQADEALIKATALQVELERMRWNGEMADERTAQVLERKQTAYEQAKTASDRVFVKRAIEYLTTMEATYGDTLGYQLQMTKLLILAGEYDEADSCLDQLFFQNEGKEEWLSLDIVLLKETYLAARQSGDYSRFTQRLQDLFATVGGGNLSNANRIALTEYLERYFQQAFTSILIGGIDAGAYPVISAYFTYRAKAEGEELTPDALTVIDSGMEITDFTLETVGGDDLNICLVFDESGSMQGDPFEDAKSAVIRFAQSVGGNTKLSLVSFSNDGVLRQAPTASTGIVARRVEELEANGGTNIAGGLATALETLRNEGGNRAIVLLSDGMDGESDLIQSVLNDLRAQRIPVYTIGFGGVDANYMDMIASETGGQFLSADDSDELLSLYTIIGKYLFSTHMVRYTALVDAEADHTLRLQRDPFDGVYDVKPYDVGITREQVEREGEREPKANFYQQTGGSGGQGWR